MTSKIKIKIGPIDVECEGSEEFLKTELLDLLTAISDLYKQGRLPTNIKSANNSENFGGDGEIPETTGSIARKLSCKTGPDLAIAAAAKLSIVDRNEKFSRQQLIDEMKSASAYFKKTYINNLTKTLRKLLIDGKLIESSKDTYALSAKFKDTLVTSIAK